jgi:AcrR family transcriptional regulator
MARPSQNIDQRLLDAGRALLPHTGCRGLSARKLVEHAGVNLGMFHYHFRNKENFIRILLDQMYEQMFAMLAIKAAESQSPIENLRNALQVLAQFAYRNRRLLLRIVTDALGGETVAGEFLRANIPRHLAVLAELIAEAQRRGQIAAVPLPQVLAFFGGSVIAPVLLGSALVEQAVIPAFLAGAFEADVLSENAAAQRIEFALRGLAPASPSKKGKS